MQKLESFAERSENLAKHLHNPPEVCDTPILLDRNRPRFTLALCVGFAYEQFTVESLKVYKGLQRFTKVYRL